MTEKLDRALRQAARLSAAGDMARAAGLYRDVLRRDPGNEAARQGLKRLSPTSGGDPVAELRAAYASGRFAEVAAAAPRIAATGRGGAAAWLLAGAAEMALDRPDRAEAAFRAAFRADPTSAAAASNLGAALRASGRIDKARKALETALRLAPDHAGALNNLGLVHQAAQDDAAAEAAFARAVEVRPDHAEALTNLGNVRQAQGRPDEAIALYKRALSSRPGHADAQYNLGLCLRKAGRPAEAVAAYEAALRLRPDHAGTNNNLGNALRALGQIDRAAGHHERAVTLAPEDPETHANLGSLRLDQGRREDAVAAFLAALKRNPDHALARAQLLHVQTHLCDWRAHSGFAEIAETLGIVGGAVPPLTLLALEDAPDRQRRRAEAFVSANYTLPGPAEPPRPRPRAGRKLRLGYFSADFRAHPVARLIAGALAAHDRDRFELFGYGFGPQSDDVHGREIRDGFARFADIRTIGDAEAARRVRRDRLDIAIDLTGHTMFSRTGLFAHRLAPVQINYLGFPGTSGAPFMDYIVADRVLVPEAAAADLTEAVIRLPHSYQPNDDRRPVPSHHLDRTAHGLPQAGLVLCSFNGAYKITPREFDIWMRVLAAVPDAVLWLLSPGASPAEALRREARKRGVDPSRLVFADRVEPEAHLARHVHADLFVDTFAYNAHTTGSDALWMGVPVVTLAGRQFAARVCASLVTAVGLPELVTRSEAEYEALVLELARDRDRLAGFRDRLDRARRTQPLFDTDGYTRALERGYEAAFDRAEQGLVPADIDIAV